MNQRLIDHYLAEKGYTPDEIEDYKMCAAWRSEVIPQKLRAQFEVYRDAIELP